RRRAPALLPRSRLSVQHAVDRCRPRRSRLPDRSRGRRPHRTFKLTRAYAPISASKQSRHAAAGDDLGADPAGFLERYRVLTDEELSPIRFARQLGDEIRRMTRVDGPPGERNAHGWLAVFTDER